jgi:hypothetical protein
MHPDSMVDGHAVVDPAQRCSSGRSGGSARRVAGGAARRVVPVVLPYLLAPRVPTVPPGSGPVWSRTPPALRSSATRDRSARRARQGRCKPRPSDASLDHPTTCSQSQIGQDHYLVWPRTAQVEAASALSVVVRWEPVRTAVTGTLVARPPRTTPVPVAPLAHLDRRVRPALDDQRSRGQEPRGLVG